MANPITRPIRVGIVGLGFMGRTHLAAYDAARQAGRANELVAVADRNAARRGGDLSGGGNIDTGAASFDPAHVRGYERPEDLLADPEVDLVSLCTPTDTHVDLALAAIEAGKHVLVEKPVALTSAEVARLADAARGAGTLCMPAMCIRFWPGWSWLRETIERGDLGALRGVSLRRLGSKPDWSSGFYGDVARTGGALFDLHVHDADLALACFGAPAAITATGDRDHVNVLWHFPGGPRVAIEGGWDHDPAFGFEMGFRAVFERGTAEYDLRRDDPLVIHAAGESAPVEIEAATGYDLEVQALLESIARGDDAPPVTVDDALAVTRVLEATAASLDGAGRRVSLE